MLHSGCRTTSNCHDNLTDSHLNQPILCNARKCYDLAGLADPGLRRTDPPPAIATGTRLKLQRLDQTAALETLADIARSRRLPEFDRLRHLL